MAVARTRRRRALAFAVIWWMVLAAIAATVICREGWARPGDPDRTPGDEVPVFLYDFGGDPDSALGRPIGLAVDAVAREIHVSDSRSATIEVFDLSGEHKRSIGGADLTVPLYLARNPDTGVIHVSDRESRSIHMFASNGTYFGEFRPYLPPESDPTTLVAPSGESTAVLTAPELEWAPLALTFDEQGRLYATDVFDKHRVLAFDSRGRVRFVIDAWGSDDRELSFPNGLRADGDSVYVVDSNNRRVHIYTSGGRYQRSIVAGSLPRGIELLDTQEGTAGVGVTRLVVADAMAHECVIWSATGERLAAFGERGSGQGQFLFPNDVAAGPGGLLFVADSENGRVQVWGPGEPSHTGLISRLGSLWPLLPIALLPLVWLARRRRFLAHQDFIEALLSEGLMPAMARRRRIWLVDQPTYDALSGAEQGGVLFDDLVRIVGHSDSDAARLAERWGIEFDQAKVLTMAERVDVFCVQDADMRASAQLLGIDAIDAEEYLTRFAPEWAEDASEPI